MSLIQLAVYSLTLWMGLYLLGRGAHKPTMRYAGLGLTTYAIALLMLQIVPAAAQWQRLLALIPAVCWLLTLALLFRDETGMAYAQRPLIAIMVATIFFVMGLGLMLLPQAWIASDILLVALGGDLLLLGYGIAALNADDEGQALLPDALRSLAATSLGVVFFGTQIGLVMVIEGASDGLQVLLLTVISSVIVMQVFALPVRRWLDRLVFATEPALQQQRANLQTLEDALPRTYTHPALDLLHMDKAEFTRLTRRALSNMQHLNRLVTSPLLQLPQIDDRLQTASSHNDATETTLQRAHALRALLTESIERLKPSDDVPTGISDEWRYYNALYYPYVAGIKPLSRRLLLDNLEPHDREVVEWFRVQVPERTLHNWQIAAAELIARDLREQMPVAIQASNIPFRQQIELTT